MELGFIVEGVVKFTKRIGIVGAGFKTIKFKGGNMIEFESIRRYMEEIDGEIIDLELEIGRSYVWVERLIDCETLENHARRIIKEYEEGIRGGSDKENQEKTAQKDLKKYLLKKEKVQNEMKKLGFSKKLSIDNWKKRKERKEKLAEIKKAYPKYILKSENSTYCRRCDRVTIHNNYQYKSGPVGFGGGIDHDYTGLRCSVCDNKIYESGQYRKLENELRR